MPEGGQSGPAASLETRFGPVLKAETLPKSEALSKRYGPSDGRLYLVRPDGYVACKARIDDHGFIEAYLSGMMRSG
jgi:hypothetical protein